MKLYLVVHSQQQMRNALEHKQLGAPSGPLHCSVAQSHETQMKRYFVAHSHEADAQRTGAQEAWGTRWVCCAAALHAAIKHR
jgi:hypothetical protein